MRHVRRLLHALAVALSSAAPSWQSRLEALRIAKKNGGGHQAVQGWLSPTMTFAVEAVQTARSSCFRADQPNFLPSLVAGFPVNRSRSRDGGAPHPCATRRSDDCCSRLPGRRGHSVLWSKHKNRNTRRVRTCAVWPGPAFASRLGRCARALDL